MTSDVEVQPTAEPSSPSAPHEPSTWPVLRSLLLRLHFYAGILVAPFLLVAATTGLLYAASYQVEKVVYSHELTVPVPAGQARLPLSQQVATATAAHPEGTLGAVRTAAGPGDTTQVLLDVPGLAESTRLAVFVDPYTGEVRGALESYGSSGALPVRTWISTFHRHLQLGEPGRLYSELAASWLWVVALGGLLLWLSRRRNGRRLRRLIAPERGVRGPRRTLSWHGSVGLWAVVGLLFLSATGLTWSKYAGANVDALQTALNWSTPALSTSAGDHADHGGGGGAGHGSTQPVDADQVTRAAEGEGLSGPLEIVWPGEPGSAYVVKETDRDWPQRNDQVAVDPATGQVTGELRFADFPIGAKLTRWGIDGHMGVLFGLPNQILLMALAAGLISVIVLGYRMWWLRRPTRGFGTPYERGDLRRLPWAVVLPLAAVVIAVGLFLPLLGISLLAFLVLDVVLGRVKASRAGAPGVGKPDAEMPDSGKPAAGSSGPVKSGAGDNAAGQSGDEESGVETSDSEKSGV
ncbi:PepSY-associated TM helix domain-containing protein [Streptosporangium lutulentum]|uniref:Iron-regulated membrane protein n=1 Tax=Streptosporangium lutulentum TaxID=1461250 RepID=A0ABT9QST4_9ACTN|nr:PepSY-associated TM helix domain-containing protein [Streptosporangium lutulentum]MDP9849821.1 putative iron-regulated membrane protein [Streptosporangium lutulentum]